jgi:hypothetical protein
MAKAIVASAALLTLLVVAPQAVGERNPPPNPAIAQYVEALPTSTGTAVPGRHARVALTKRVTQKLPHTPEGQELRDIASDSAYGAPQHKLHASKRAAVAARRAVMEPKSGVSGATFGAAVDAVGAKRNVVLWLGFAVFAIAAFGVGAAVARARS